MRNGVDLVIRCRALTGQRGQTIQYRLAWRSTCRERETLSTKLMAVYRRRLVCWILVIILSGAHTAQRMIDGGVLVLSDSQRR